jgi:hypothetical protein
MILVDTSVWIDHLRQNDETLARLLGEGQVLAHPFVTGELALGNLRNRDTVVNALRDLPQAVVACDEEVIRFIERHALFGIGIGYNDAHLLASVRLTPGATLWTRDKRLLAAGAGLGLIATLSH